MQKEIKNRPVLFLLGPTACGKTDLAAALYDAFPSELIGVDAAQVYRGMDIGTAKPDADFLRKYPHHLIDICAPTETYTAARFCADARAAIAAAHAAEKLPILVGGSMFYFAALEKGLSELPAADAKLRRQLDEEIMRDGLPAMHAQLQLADPKLAAKIQATDRQRIQRAMEIYRLSGRPPSAMMAESVAPALPHRLIKLGLFVADRAVLHARIAARFETMLTRGLVAEVEALLAALPAGGDYPALRVVGYRQVAGYLRGEYGYDEMVARGVAATRQLAKRQLTWMRGQKGVVWVDAGESVVEFLRAVVSP